MKKVWVQFLIILILAHCQVLTVSAKNLNLKPDNQVLNSRIEKYDIRNFASRKYILGPNDVISISVLGIPEFTFEKVRIQPDGSIALASIGVINVAGLTTEEFYKVITDKFSEYIVNPRITVNLVETKPFVVYVTGAVLNPGSYEVNTNTSENAYMPAKNDVKTERKSPLLSNILVAAGGISYDADLEHIQITNKFDNSKYDLNLLDLLDKSDSSQDIYLMPGDMVFIPKLPTPFALKDEIYKKYAAASFSPRLVPVRVFGYVNNPGLVQLDPAQSLNLNSAIMSAGGYLKDSAYTPNKVFISRVDAGGKLVTKAVNPMSSDIALMPNDIVYVPEKVRPLAGKAFDYTVRIFNPVNTFANTYNNWALMFNPTRYQVIGK